MTPTRRAEWLAAYNASLNGLRTNDGFGPGVPDALLFASKDADAALAAADERFPPAEPCPSCGNIGNHATFCRAKDGIAEWPAGKLPWPEAGSSLPEGVGESMVQDDPIRVTLGPRFYLGVPCVRALVEAAREYLNATVNTPMPLESARKHGCLRTALVPFSEPAPKAKLPEPNQHGQYVVGEGIVISETYKSGVDHTGQWFFFGENARTHPDYCKMIFPTAQAALDALVAEGLVKS